MATIKLPEVPFLIKWNGEMEPVLPKNGKDFQLEELYKMLGCELVEVVYLGSSHMLIIDEEGKLKPHKPNLAATALAQIPGDYIAGDAIICKRKFFK